MFIAVEGCIGAGKTTIANGLAMHRKSDILREAFETNPFLPAFYEDPASNVTETEFAFLLVHYHQLRKHLAPFASGEWIADFHLGKDLLYAELNLEDPSAMRIFRDLYGFLSEAVSKPDLLICLSASTDLLLERIRQRKRAFELNMDPDYCARLNTAYEEYFDRYQGPKMRLSMNELDFIANPGLFQSLSYSVDEMLANK